MVCWEIQWHAFMASMLNKLSTTWGSCAMSGLSTSWSPCPSLSNILLSLRSTYLCVCYNFDIFLGYIGNLTTWSISNVNKNCIVWHFTPMLERKVEKTQCCKFTVSASVSFCCIKRFIFTLFTVIGYHHYTC